MSIHVFTYGSLMFPEVWRRVVRGHYASQPACIDGHQRYAVNGDTYPGIVIEAGASVTGLVYRDINAADLAALDHFEGDGYHRIGLQASTDDGVVLAVQTYLFRDPAGLSDQPWLPHEFQLQRFLGSYCRDKLGS
ncbi:MAG: gamma-glutamylcyclotransferase (GGCT)/AIG2-like uncharacterized protein YtfP [Burkholderiaceae bacterium]|jgi:gamma-glutamylcyclotransferase (GGCT)/AIG2-like uncharacterized protein YtfP